jgi:esterase/lipase
VCTLASVQRAMPMIAAANKRLVVLDDSYHMITIDNDRHKVADELIAFSAISSAITSDVEFPCPTPCVN